MTGPAIGVEMQRLSGEEPEEDLALPASLAQAYGGGLGLAPDCLYANVVSSIDGVIAGDEVLPSAIAGGSLADRFVMGLLRAAADAILIGAGTLRAEPHHRWTPAHPFPAAAGEFLAFRRQRGIAELPALVVVTATGDLAGDLGAFGVTGQDCLVVTTPGGAARLGHRPLGAGVAVVAAGSDGKVAAPDLLGVLAARGYRRVLTEAGPRLLGQFLAAGVLDEVFLTVSPVVAGGVPGGRGLAGTVPLAPPAGRPSVGKPASLRSLRRHGSHLMARYTLGMHSHPRTHSPSG